MCSFCWMLQHWILSGLDVNKKHATAWFEGANIVKSSKAAKKIEKKHRFFFCIKNLDYLCRRFSKTQFLNLIHQTN